MNDRDLLSDEDIALFRNAVQDVNRLHDDHIVLKPARRPRPRPSTKGNAQDLKIADNLSEVFIADCEEYVEFNRGGIQNTVLKKLRTGKLPPEEHLDLHGQSVPEARRSLLRFIRFCGQRNVRVVCIIHGKGYRSDGNRAVLKPMVNEWLRQLNEVLAFATAQPADGGTGAVYILLRRER